MRRIIYLIVVLLLLGFVYRPNNFIILHGHKYYKCTTDVYSDTLEEPGGVTIISRRVSFYDYYKCKDLD